MYIKSKPLYTQQMNTTKTVFFVCFFFLVSDRFY
uniref:Uncharacterized protein n=1 Tax=Anguilla anguilla TaxID=7936 RepID=A0A0E9VRF7_ANGAN